MVSQDERDQFIRNQLAGMSPAARATWNFLNTAKPNQQPTEKDRQLAEQLTLSESEMISYLAQVATGDADLNGFSSGVAHENLARTWC